MYGIITAASWIIRTFLLPNPFIGTLYPDVYNWIASSVLPIITFLIVGIFYEKRSFPVLGSFLFLFFYFVHNGLIELAGYFDFSKLSIYIIIGLYVVVLAVIKSMLWSRGY